MPAADPASGTNQQDAAVRIAAGRYHAGAAPLVIATGGINRHDGSTEEREFARRLAEAGCPPQRSGWKTAPKWHHLRAVYCLRTQLPEAVPLYAIGWEPSYGGQAVTRETGPQVPGGRRRVIRETSEVARRVADGSYAPALKRDSTWW